MSEPETKVLYLDGVAWQHELGSTEVDFYKSLEAIQKDRACAKQCGVVRVEMKATWVVEQNFDDLPDAGQTHDRETEQS